MLGFMFELINTKLQVKNEDNAKYKGLVSQRSFYNIVLRSIFVTLILCYKNRIQGIDFRCAQKKM
jgi:small nuclear ribonucleoprotein (snRNP)-like protein